MNRVILGYFSHQVLELRATVIRSGKYKGQSSDRMNGSHESSADDDGYLRDLLLGADHDAHRSNSN